MTPSKFLSIDFLRKLRENKYCSHNNKGEIKEYNKIEVDNLYFSKLDKQQGVKITSIDVFISMQEFLNESYCGAMYFDVMPTWDDMYKRCI